MVVTKKIEKLTAGQERDILRVPPTTKTAREACAWTFELEEHEYTLVAQS